MPAMPGKILRERRQGESSLLRQPGSSQSGGNALKTDAQPSARLL
jgi:hypothetical protein